MPTNKTELIFGRPELRATGAAVVPPESVDDLEAKRSQYGVETKWSYVNDPRTGEQRRAFTPIEGGRLALIEDQGIEHGDRSLATFEVREVTRESRIQSQMWLVAAQPIE